MNKTYLLEMKIIAEKEIPVFGISSNDFSTLLNVLTYVLRAIHESDIAFDIKFIMMVVKK